MSNKVQYLFQDKYDKLKEELKFLTKTKKLEIAKRIDEARQMGDLSENAEYHAAREDMGWTMARAREITSILDNSEIITKGGSSSIGLGSTITVEVRGKEKEYTITGPQEADPLNGKISNESPLGSAFLGKKKGDVVEVQIPSGTQEYKILNIQ
ncbi:MAG: transcription elongation factor GreA [Candidatus Magasanikbacteria bacterium]|nr:transcription elongation factor GreA [Candidatus Magasanikbacteria bacterium]